MKFEELRNLLLSSHLGLFCEERGGEFVIVKKIKTGEFIVARSKTEEGAYRSAAAFYNL